MDVLSRTIIQVYSLSFWLRHKNIDVTTMSVLLLLGLSYLFIGETLPPVGENKQTSSNLN